MDSYYNENPMSLHLNYNIKKKNHDCFLKENSQDALWR